MDETPRCPKCGKELEIVWDAIDERGIWFYCQWDKLELPFVPKAPGQA